MAEQHSTDAGTVHQLWTRLTDTRIGMLWAKGSDQHPQPMTHYVDAEGGHIWFITSSDTDLVSAIGPGTEGQFLFMSSKGDYQASLSGPMVVYPDEDKLNELWSLPVAAWFEKGREDPRVTLVRFTPREAAIWASDGNPVMVGMKMLSAALRETSQAPDVGTHRVVHLNEVA